MPDTICRAQVKCFSHVVPINPDMILERELLYSLQTKGLETPSLLPPITQPVSGRAGGYTQNFQEPAKASA